MADRDRIEAGKQLLPSVLDRLIDLDPRSTQEAPQGRNQVLRELKQSVRRDLEELLNTRRRPFLPPERLTELNRSILRYGIPDLADVNIGTGAGREAFRRAVEDAVRIGEPRFKSVKVQLLDKGREDRTLHFRIEALMWADPAPEQVAFDTVLDPVSTGFSVKAAAGGPA
jgi:type VI secretion system protein ImpF